MKMSKEDTLNIVITAGGVTERIDSVRKITNSSTGKLGVSIENELRRRYPMANITLIGSKQTTENEMISKATNKITIESTADLEREVKKILVSRKVDIFIHSMAVADYTTESVIDVDKFKEIIQSGCTDAENAMEIAKVDISGKISSQLNMMIKMKQTPKIIKMIKELSPRTFLIGFKLLNGVTEEHLFDVGFNLLRKNRCNLVVANDLENIRNGNHRALIIYPEKSYDVVEGKSNIAGALGELIERRAFVLHPHSKQLDENNGVNKIGRIKDVFKEIKKTGKELFDNGYLPTVVNHEREDKIGTYGNISVKTDNDIIITGRNVHKGKLQKDDVCRILKVESEMEDDNVYANVIYDGKIKPSIDTAIHDYIYKATRCKAIIHVHTNKIFLGYPYVNEQFPCGSQEERDAIISAMLLKCKDWTAFDAINVVQMKKHGLIIAAKDLATCKEKLNELFNATPYINTDVICNDEEVMNHIEDVNAQFAMRSGHLYNLELADKTIGCIWEEQTDEAVSFGIFTKDSCAKGLHIVEKYLKLYDKRYMLYTTVGCHIENFYKEKYGFKELYRDTDNMIILYRPDM